MWTANPEFSYIVSGTLLNGYLYTAVTGVPVYSVADSPNSPVGSTFPINVSGLVSQNYTLTFVLELPDKLLTAATTTALTTSATPTQYGDPGHSDGNGRLVWSGATRNSRPSRKAPRCWALLRYSGRTANGFHLAQRECRAQTRDHGVL